MNYTFSKWLMPILFLGAVSCNEAGEQKTEQAEDVHAALRKTVDSLAGTLPAKIGVAMLHLESGDTFSYNGGEQMPMQSVYKFPLAMMVLDGIDSGKYNLMTAVQFFEEDMDEETHSPLRDKYKDRGVKLLLHEVLYYTVAQSDNIGCDVLFHIVGGPRNVDSFMTARGFDEIEINSTEVQLHEDWRNQYKNWCTPVEMTHILDAFYKGKMLSQTMTDTLRNIMERTTGGGSRIKGLLPEGTVVAHKTGTCMPNDELSNTVNDVGVVTLPDGKHLAIALFVTDAKADIPDCEKVMAQIAKAIYDSQAK